MPTTKYTPMPPPVGGGDALARWMFEELRRVASAMEAHEATTVNYGKEVRNVASGAALTVDWKAGQKQRVEMGADCTLTFAPPLGVCNLVLRVVQDGTGGWTPTMPGEVKWTGGGVATFTQTAGAVDVVAMFYDGTYYHSTMAMDSK